MGQYNPDCWSCQNLQGKRQVSRAPRILEGAYWNVEHVPETSVPGWIVVVLRRHAAAMHELTNGEFEELGSLIRKCSRALHSTFSTAKEYLMQFAEAEHFRHVHIHLVPRLPDWPEEFRGPQVFGAMGKDIEDKLSVEQMTVAASAIREALTADAAA